MFSNVNLIINYIYNNKIKFKFFINKRNNKKIKIRQIIKQYYFHIHIYLNIIYIKI